MEFYVVDPKNLDFSTWTDRVRDFLSDESSSFTESTGEVFYLGDDIAVPWDEDSVLFSVGGEEGGVVEVRDADEHFYVFIDDLDLFDEKEIKDSIGYRGMSMGPLFGFRWNDQGTCRFHTGHPSVTVTSAIPKTAMYHRGSIWKTSGRNFFGSSIGSVATHHESRI